MATQKIFNTVGGEDVIVLCDTLQDYTDILSKGTKTVYLIKKGE